MPPLIIKHGPQKHYAVADVVPHANRMILIDQILDYSEETLTASVTIHKSSMFLNTENVVPSWVGIEYMAQSISAWAGIHAKLKRRPVKIGYLLGTRCYETNQPEFILGDTLKIFIKRIFQENELGVFDCEISNNRILINALVNVFQPE